MKMKGSNIVFVYLLAGVIISLEVFEIYWNQSICLSLGSFVCPKVRGNKKRVREKKFCN